MAARAVSHKHRGNQLSHWHNAQCKLQCMGGREAERSSEDVRSEGAGSASSDVRCADTVGNIVVYDAREFQM